MPRRGPVKYSILVGTIFLFNLVVGTGALALPGALQKAGYLVGVALLLILGLFSFITVTFVIEALGDANALSKKVYTAENTPLVSNPEDNVDIFDMTEKYELGQMGVLMTPKWSQVIIYLCLCIYLYGDLAIYETVIGRCSTSIFCTYHGNNSAAGNESDSAPCWENVHLSRKNFYRVSVATFICLIGPFVFFNLKKTMGLQILTVTLRWLAFLSMIIWNSVRLGKLGAKGHPPLMDLLSVPTLFGTLVYAFMCQHSIPGLLQPITDKKYLTRMVFLDYAIISCFYITLSLTSVFSFEKVEDILTLNFWNVTAGEKLLSFERLLAYYLSFFPIFTLSTSFPIIGITLRNNLKSLIFRERPTKWYYDRLLLPFLTILPPTALSLYVDDVHLLVGVVGSYAGACIQYMIPCLLVQFGRKQVKDIRGTNQFASPFKHLFWIIAVYVWMVISLVFITVNYIFKFSHKK